jgi:sensor domain CHASE-containing protein
MEYNSSIRALQIADKDTRVILVYPPKGNEITITKPMVLIDDPLRGTYVRKAIREQRATVQDPFELRQGGFGFAVRNPIFDEDRFLGLAIAVLDVPVIVNEVFPEAMSEKYSLELFDARGKTFYSNSIPVSPMEERMVPIGDITWSLSLGYRNYEAFPPWSDRMLHYFKYHYLI